ncbi:hypothetical protein F2Q69_00036201 [Brassica cretica]|uniref:Retrotransposon gag domain-containing protein n=1 Tax=Brassica cretica TaxID=69181 RepID=A0A8S9SDG4_BRACR|nr:hypothetical protein F2Q69_00036201 [Brassica cretica]
MPRNFSFPNIKMFDGTGDPDDHIAQYKQRLLAIALPKVHILFREPQRKVCMEQFASSRSLEKTSDGLYEILQHRAQMKWEEDVASRAKAQPKQDQKSARSDQGNWDERSSQRATKDSENRNRGRFQYRPLEKEEGMSVSTWPDILISTPELVNVLRQMGQQVKWPQKMKAPDSFRNPGLWCDFHRDHSHKTEDCVALRIEVNELLQKGHLREFLSEKAKNHLNKEVSVKSAGAIPASPPLQDQVIHVISGGSEISGAYADSSFSSSCIDSILFCISCWSSGVDVVSIDAIKCLSVDAGALLSIDLERFLVIDADIWC